MRQESPIDAAAAAAERDLLGLSREDKPTIRILLYTDDRKEIVQAPVGKFGLGRMIKQLQAHAPAFANLRVKWVSRYPSGSSKAKNRINVVLADAEEARAPFDQVWFFGLHQVNKKNFVLGLSGGGPESELDTCEVEELRRRMDAGLGVLMTGDHANAPPADALPPDPHSPCPDHRGQKTFLGLGRALGRCVPRAGLLRDWEGPPTTEPRFRNDTQVVTFGTGDADQPSLESDPIPQQLVLRTFNQAGKPVLGGQPHPLFFYRQGRAIRLFPDHPHEGAVVIPKELKACEWPTNAEGFQPKPRAVAYGLDKRTGRRFKLLAAYDGDRVGAGRIVADSTWHHYFNINLTRFQDLGEEGSASDQIGQYYGNLALWLSPLEKRYEMFDVMMRRLIDDPELAEEIGPVPLKRLRDIMAAGRLAGQLLSRAASACEIHELLQLTVAERYRGRFETLYLPDKGSELSPFPSKELMLGHLIQQYQQAQTETLGLTLSDDTRRGMCREAIAVGSESAFRRQARRLARVTISASKFFREEYTRSPASPEKREPEVGSEANLDDNQSSKRRSAMAACTIDPTKRFDIELILDKDPGRSEIITFHDVRSTAGQISGEVRDSRGAVMSNLTGTCAAVPSTGQADLSAITFIFSVTDVNGRVAGLYLTGLAFPNPADPTRLVFLGVLRAFTPLVGVTPEVVGGHLDLLAIDPGDTGTGNGSQT